MKYTKYSKYAPDAAEDIDLQELMSRLSDFFLQSGYESQFGIYEMDPERSREQNDGGAARSHPARAAGRRSAPARADGADAAKSRSLAKPELRDVIEQIIQRMEEEGFISRRNQPAQITPPPSQTPGGQVGEATSQTSKRASKSPTKRSIFSASKR